MFHNFLNLLYFCILVKTIKASTNIYGVLAAESPSDKENFCIIYFKEFAPLPEERSKAELHQIEDASFIDWCSDSKFESKSKILLLTRNNCSVSEQASHVQEQGGKGILFITPSSEIIVPINGTLAKDINITVGLISENSVKRLHNMGNAISGRMFSPHNLNFDFSLLFIWFVAMFTVTVGSYWSGHIRFIIYSKEISVLPAVTEGTEVTSSLEAISFLLTVTEMARPEGILRIYDSNLELTREFSTKASSTDSSINVSPYYVGFFVLCMGGMRLLLYFFFDYLVYYIIGLFVLASIISIHSCLEPLVLKIPGNFCKITKVGLGNFICVVDYRQILLIAFSFAVSITWFIIRKQKYAWILQDILGVACCINMLKSKRLPSLKICTVLLVLLFFYDIFFVFVTPYLTMTGKSVIEELVTGGKSDETLPMVLKVVKFNALAVCYQQYSILGFGDILFPGLLISYCHGFDLITSKKRLYFPITVATYGIGLLIAFIGLILMNTAKPALLYIVPTTLIPPIILGWCRSELGLLWKSLKVMRLTEAAKSDAPANNTLADTHDGTVVHNDVNSGDLKAQESTHESVGEKKLLQ